jgi:transcriptional regulator
MFVRPCWRPKSPLDVRRVIEENSWALLVSQTAEGPLATNLPLLLESQEPLVLVGHIARANQHFAALQHTEAPVLAIFEGPWSYVTASWYPKRQMPSTYYYTAVHCYGGLEFQDEEALDRSLGVLVNQMESAHPKGWKTSEIPRSEITRRFAAIIGFRMHVTRVEAKFKLGQDEPLGDALAVADILATHGAHQDRQLAEMIRGQNAGRKN